MKLKHVVSAAVASAALLAGGVAQAATWAWSFTGTGVTASGTFTTAGAATSPEDILSFSGTYNGQTILGLVPLDTNPDFFYDNQFTSVAPYFSEAGILFDVGGGAAGVHNIYYWADDNTLYDLVVVNGQPSEVPITFTVTAVPEAATLVYMGLGLAGVAFVARRSRRKEQEAATA